MKKNKSSKGSLGTQIENANNGLTSEASSSRTPANDGGTRSEPLGGSAAVTGISFGREPKAAAGSTQSSSSELSAFLQGTLSKGVTGSATSLLSSSGLFDTSGLGAIGSLLSGLGGLFGGGKSQPAPLPAFSLPGSQIQNISVHGDTAAVNTASHSSSSYGQLPDSGSAVATSLGDQSQQIAQAVKTALLQSHSLSDVISEL